MNIIRPNSRFIKLLFKTCLLYAFLLYWNTTEINAQVKVAESGYKYFEMTTGDSTIVMREYFMCFLKTGENRSQSEKEANEIQTAHLAHLSKLYTDGKTCITGPFGDEGDIRGVVIFIVNSKEEAEKLANMDPAVKAGRLAVEIRPWWGMKGAVLK